MARLYPRRTIFVFWVYSRLFEHAKAQTCYLPGTTASEDISRQQFPCDPYAYTTLCCPLGWTCFSNNLCVVTDETAVSGEYSVGTALRGTCTNPYWNDTACGDFCLDDLDNGSLQNCGGGNWCCQSAVDSGTCDCESGTGTFSIPDGEAQTIIGVTGSGSTSTGSSSATLSSSAIQTTSSTVSSTSPRPSSSQSSTPTSSTSKTSSSPTSTSKSSTLLTSTTSSSHTSPSSTSHTSSSTSSAAATAATTTPSLTTGQKAGISVGVILGVAALAIGAFCLWWFWWRHRERRRNVPAMSEADSDVYIPEPTSAVPGPILRPNPDPYEYRGNDGLRLSPVSDAGSGGRVNRRNDMNSGWSGGYSGGFAGRVTDERIRPVVDPYRMPYEGT